MPPPRPRPVSSGGVSLFRTLPTLKRPLWGGSRLAAEFGKGEGIIGESWECWPDGLLADGRRVREVADLPVLVKLIDTREVLSVQVHPGDEAARGRGHPHGKAEAWVVLDALPGARVAWGLRRELSRAELRERALSGAIEADLAWFEPRPGDVIEVPPGTIHAIGPGLLLYEVQEPIDLTWRLYDWGRGRELHLEEACEVARLEVVSDPCRPMGERDGVLLQRVEFRLSRRTDGAWWQEGWAAFTALGNVTLDGEEVRRGETVVLGPGEHGSVGGAGLVAEGGEGPHTASIQSNSPVTASTAVV